MAYVQFLSASMQEKKAILEEKFGEGEGQIGGGGLQIRQTFELVLPTIGARNFSFLSAVP